MPRLRFLSRGWWRRLWATCTRRTTRAAAPPPTSSLPSPRCVAPTLHDLPDLAAIALLSFLDAASLRALVLDVCRGDALLPLVTAFRRRFVLRLPPDAPRNAVLMRAITRASDALVPPPDDMSDATVARATATRNDRSGDALFPLLATQFAVVDTSHAAELLPLSSRVRGLVVSSNEYTWPKRPFQWDILSQFVALERLVIAHAFTRPLDLALLSQSCPRLQELVIKEARALVRHRRLQLPELRVLHVEDTNHDSFDLAVGLPKLQSLTLLATLHAAGPLPLYDIRLLAAVPPLTRLVVRGVWQVCPHAAMAPHYETLREYAELDNARLSRYPWTSHHPEWSKMVNLCSLRLGWQRQTDMEPFAALPQLEHLQLVVADSCMDCVPLRRLTRLKELQMANGWVCDLVGFLPRLEKLVWETMDSYPHQPARVKLWRRHHPDDLLESGKEDGDRVSTLRELVLRGAMLIEDDDPCVEKLLRHVEQLEVCDNQRIKSLLPSIARLRRVKRLAIRLSNLPYVPHASARVVSFACADTLEELFCLPGQYYADIERRKVVAPLPLWFHDRLPNLRVLASPFQESMVELAIVCPRLTHVHLPFSTSSHFSVASRETLRRLCVVTVALEYDCTWLRRERGVGRALPSLQRIYHPTTDCLSSPSHCQRHAVLGHTYVWFRDALAAEKRLRGPWRHEWHYGKHGGPEAFYHTIQDA